MSACFHGQTEYILYYPRICVSGAGEVSPGVSLFPWTNRISFYYPRICVSGAREVSLGVSLLMDKLNIFLFF